MTAAWIATGRVAEMTAQGWTPVRRHDRATEREDAVLMTGPELPSRGWRAIGEVVGQITGATRSDAA